MSNTPETNALAYLRELGAELTAQNNQATNAPMYQVIDILPLDVNGETVNVREVQSTFFTYQAAQDYLKSKAGKLSNPTIYVDSGFENPEWLALRALAIDLHNAAMAE